MGDHIWVLPEKYNDTMKRNGCVIFRPPLDKRALMSNVYDDTKNKNIDMIIGYSRGFDHGIVEFELKCINPGRDAIGIMSEIEECEKEQWIAATKGNSYYWTAGSGIYTGKGTQNRPDEQYIGGNLWEIGDRIKMRLDCVEWVVSFYQNGEQVG